MHGLVVREGVKYITDVKAIIRQFTIAPNEYKLHMVVGDTKKSIRKL
jgi:hydrogenase maturation factor